MKIKPLLRSARDPVFVGIVLLQIATFGFVASGQSDTMSLAQAVEPLAGSSVLQGSKAPAMTAYDDAGRRQNTLVSGRANTVIFASRCSCEVDQVRYWAGIATRRGENVTIIVPAWPRQLRQTHFGLSAKTRVLAMRPADFLRLGTTNHLPLVVRVLSEGTVASAQ